MVSGGRHRRYHGASLTQHSGQHPPTDLITLDGQGFMGPAASPGSHLIPALPTGKLLSNSVPAAKRRHSYTRPPPSTRGCRGQAPPRIWNSPGQVPSSPRGSRGQAPPRIWSSHGQVPSSPRSSHVQAPPRIWSSRGHVPRQGWVYRSRAHSSHCRAPPAHLLVRADPEHLRAGLELTNSSSDRSVTLGFTLCGLPPPGLPGASTAAGAPGLCLHPPSLLSLTPGFLSCGEGLLEVVSHSWTR